MIAPVEDLREADTGERRLPTAACGVAVTLASAAPVAEHDAEVARPDHSVAVEITAGRIRQSPQREQESEVRGHRQRIVVSSGRVRTSPPAGPRGLRANVVLKTTAPGTVKRTRAFGWRFVVDPEGNDPRRPPPGIKSPAIKGNASCASPVLWVRATTWTVSSRPQRLGLRRLIPPGFEDRWRISRHWNRTPPHSF